MIKKTIGILIVVFAGLFYATATVMSLKQALLIWGSSIILTAVVVGAVFLAVGN